MAIVPEKEVAEFLKNVKKIISIGEGLKFYNRPENLKTLLDLGLTSSDVINTLKYLSVTDYCKGPEPDRDRPGEFWFFGKTIKGKSIYIKLKIKIKHGRDTVYCISFHEPKYCLGYPYAE